MTKIFLLVTSWLPNEKVNFEPWLFVNFIIDKFPRQQRKKECRSENNIKVPGAWEHFVQTFPGPRGFLLFFLGKFCDANRFFYLFRFYWREVLSAEKRSLCSRLFGILTFTPSAFDRRFWLEDIFNCSTSHMIGWIKYLWRCDCSKENDIFDSFQVLG